MRVIFLTLFLFTAPALAADVNPAGQRLAATCANCHGTDGVSAGGAMGSLAGMSAPQMQKALQDFRKGSRPSTVMAQLMKGYSEDELQALASWFAARPTPSPAK